MTANSKTQADDVDERITALNTNFKGSGYQFTLKDTDWNVNQKWAKYQDVAAMQKKLRKGDEGTLNLYYHTFVEDDDTNGLCSFPVDAADNLNEDSCHILYSAPLSTTVHETGHWFGLLHVSSKIDELIFNRNRGLTASDLRGWLRWRR